VITAPNAEALRALRSVITQLDVRRAQVLVEAAIAEISGERVAELGVQWIVDGSQSGSMVGFTNFTLGTSLAKVAETALAIANGATGAGATVSGLSDAIPRGLALGVGSFRGSTRFAAIISALASDSDTNVLSTPNLVTLDNEEAEIFVGEERSFVSGSFGTGSNFGSNLGSSSSSSDGGFRSSGVVNPFQTTDRKKIGLNLKIKPQINEGNAVQLEISQKVSNFVGEGVDGPITTEREIKTNVLVEDGQILVLGGLIDDSLSEGMQKVPGLGDIPVLGHLFRYRNTTKRKRNLMVFIHPLILRDASQGSASTNDKYSYIREQQIEARQRGVALMPEAQTPLLKPPAQVQQQGTLLNLQPPPEPVPPPQPAPAPVSSQIDEGFNSR
jgi:general secretion pathway protein D